MRTAHSLNRREFIVGAVAAGTGLTIIASCGGGDAGRAADGIAREWDPRPFLHIGADNIVTVFSKSTEMGQGIFTGFATIIAEELDADWRQVRVEAAPANEAIYGNLEYGSQSTGGSNSIHTSYGQMRQVGATARYLLVAAAAEAWQVPADEIDVDRGRIRHVNTDRQATFGEFAEAAAKQGLPDTVVLKDPDQFNLIGGEVSRVDIPAKIDGSAVYTIDVELPGMLTAVVAHAPRFGSRVASFDSTAAKAVAGVVDVVEIPTGVAVVADNFWTASRAREQLDIEWDHSQAMKESSAELLEEFSASLTEPGSVAREEGAGEAALETAAKTLEVDYQLPYLAHATLEPLNCVVRWTGNACEIWAGTQSQSWNLDLAAEILGVDRDSVKVNTLYAGGGYGRRACWDVYSEALHIVKALGTDVPVKLQWSREDDMRAGEYRPLTAHRLCGGLDDEGRLIAWTHRVVTQSISEQKWPGSTGGATDWLTTSGAADYLYEVPNIHVDEIAKETPVPVLWLRGVAETHTIFTVESFIDELAHAAGRDPVEFRRGMLAGHPRMQAVLDLAAKRSGWSASELAPGRGRGVAMCRARGTYIAQVAEVSVVDDGSLSVDRLVTAVDCGVAINPDIVRAQIEGGAGFALSSTLGEEITIENGAPLQSNFDRYPLLRMSGMPEVEVHLVESLEPPGGIGEVGATTVSAAVANAVFRATGRRIRTLPIRNLA